MIGYIRSISVFASEANLCQIECEKFQTNQKSHFSMQNVAKNLGLLPSTIHNIVKRLRESRKISVCVGQGRTPQLIVLDL